MLWPPVGFHRSRLFAKQCFAEYGVCEHKPSRLQMLATQIDRKEGDVAVNDVARDQTTVYKFRKCIRIYYLEFSCGADRTTQQHNPLFVIRKASILRK